MLAALLFGAINYSNALAYLLSFLLAGLGVVSILHTQRNLLRLRVTVAPGEPVFGGEPALFRVCLHNDGGARFALRLETREGAAPSPLDVPARDTRCVLLSVPASQRGWRECPTLTVASVYPLGIARAWSRRLRLPARCLVYPRPADEAEAQSAPGNDGESRPGTQPDGEDFAGLRVYQSGDPLSRISWKTLARGQGHSARVGRSGRPGGRSQVSASLGERRAKNSPLLLLLRQLQVGALSGLTWVLHSFARLSATRTASQPAERSKTYARGKFSSRGARENRGLDIFISPRSLSHPPCRP